MNLGTPELLVTLVIVLLVFGGAKLPKLARSLGQAYFNNKGVGKAHA